MIYTFGYTELDYQELPLLFRYIGIHHHQEPIQRPSGAAFYQWFYCAKGSGEIVINGERSVISKGQGVLIYPEEAHSYRAVTPDWIVHFFGFDGAGCREIIRVLKMKESGVYHFSDTDLFLKHMQKTLYLFETDLSGKKSELSKECYNLLLDLSHCITHVSSIEPAHENEIIRRIMLYLEEHYSEYISLEDLSEHVKLSKEYICSLFKKHMQRTVMYALLEIRIARARIFLVQYPEKRVQEIAQMCGFESPSYFCKVFRKMMGMTPGEYRTGNMAKRIRNLVKDG